MLTQFWVKNIRCFSDLHLKDLGRINLIAGKNNTGKTALLEAMHLYAYPSDAMMPFTINHLRGTPTDTKFDPDAWDWLHYNKDSSHEIELMSQNEKGETRTLRIWVTDAATARTTCPEAGKLLEGSFLQGRWEGEAPCFILRKEQNGEPPRHSVGLPEGSTGMSSLTSKAPWVGPSLFIGSAGRSQEEDVKAFSELEAANRQEEVLHSLQLLEPRLRRLSILLLAQKPAIYGDIGLSRLVPLQFMGEGVRRLLSIIAAIAGARGGTVLIDEIENGLHYSVQEKVWDALANAARRANVQIFATTHSWECIEAAHRAFKASRPYELRFYRLDRRGEEIMVKSFDERMLDTVEKSDLEVR